MENSGKCLARAEEPGPNCYCDRTESSQGPVFPPSPAHLSPQAGQADPQHSTALPRPLPGAVKVLGTTAETSDKHPCPLSLSLLTQTHMHTTKYSNAGRIGKGGEEAGIMVLNFSKLDSGSALTTGPSQQSQAQGVLCGAKSPLPLSPGHPAGAQDALARALHPSPLGLCLSPDQGLLPPGRCSIVPRVPTAQCCPASQDFPTAS